MRSPEDWQQALGKERLMAPLVSQVVTDCLAAAWDCRTTQMLLVLTTIWMRYGCTTSIGNYGPPPLEDGDAIDGGDLVPKWRCTLGGNREF